VSHSSRPSEVKLRIVLRRKLPAGLTNCGNYSPTARTAFLHQTERFRFRLAHWRRFALIGNEKLALPAVVSWSPNSTQFFLNDGDGSGLSSQLRLFRIIGATAKENDDLNRTIVRIYRDRNRCSKVTKNPNVYGVGWSPDGVTLYVVAQSTVNNPCGEPTKYLGFILDVEKNEIKQILSTQQARAKFDQYLPRELR
jgi:hypothetical protein